MTSPHKIVGELMANNDPPSDAAIEEAKRRLDGPLQDIVEIDAEIVDLEQRIHELRIKRGEKDTLITRYRAVLAPIRRVPLDILGEIFQRCLSTHRNPIMKATECPMLLTRVCSTWRTTAISNPRLWARVYITFSDDDKVSESELDGPAAMDGDHYAGDIDWGIAMGQTYTKQRLQRAKHMLRIKCDALKEWFSRSGELDLSISIFFTSNFNWSTESTYVASSSRVNSDADPGIAEELLGFIAALSPRLEDLELQMPLEVYRVLDQRMNVSEMKKLTSIRAKCYPQSAHSGTQGPIVLFKAPNLRRISIYAFKTVDSGILEPTYARCWSKLTEISCHHPLSENEIIWILGNTPNLVHFKAHVVQYASTPGFNDQGPLAISLPFLLTLSITDICDPQNISGRLYERIDAPALRQFMYSRNFYQGFSTNTDDPPPIPMLPLLRKSRGLKKLAIDVSDGTLKRWDIRNVLRDVHTVTHLVIGPWDAQKLPSGHPAVRIPSISVSRCVQHYMEVDLEGLVFAKAASNDVQCDPPLLPHLQSLEVSSRTVYVSEDVLFRLAISRINHPSSPSFSQIANLKHVAAVFYEKKQGDLDIATEIQRHAECVGVDRIDLALQYPEVIELPEINPIAPDFGLRSADGRSWCHTDAGDYADWM